MPDVTLWGLVVSLAILALGLTYKCVENAHALKLSDKEADRLRTALNTLEETRKNESLSFRAEIDALKEIHNKEVSDIKELHQRETEKLREELHEKPPSRSNLGFVDNGVLKWKIQFVNGHMYTVQDVPYCVQHDLKLKHFRDGYACFHIGEDGCESQLSDKDYSFRREYAESLMEQKIRKPEKQV